MSLPKLSLSRSENQKGLLFGVLASFSFATYILINRYVYINYNVDIFSYAVTFIVAGGIIAGVSLAFSYLQESFRIIHKNNFPLVFNGMLAGIGLGLFVFGQGYTTAINASILATVTIVTTVLYSKLLLKQTLNRNQRLALLMMFVGLYLAIVGTRVIHLNKGDLIVIMSSVILGYTNVFSKILMKNHDSNFIANVRLLSGGLLLMVLGLIVKSGDVFIVSAGLWPLLAGLFFWLTIRFFYASIHYTGPNNAIVIANSHPIFTPIVGVFLLGEPYGWTKLLGSILILIGVYFINKKSSPNPVA